MLILNYQRISTEDGPGIRTTLFVKGCPLACTWCHNPESIEFRKQIEWIEVRCIGCKICLKSCNAKALSMDKDGAILIDRDTCTLCLKCVSECPALALECKGEEKSVGEIFSELIKDKAYFTNGGGVTLSGGEILSQSKEAAELLKLLKNAGVHTAVDTSGLCKKSDIDAVLPYTDLFLYDIKHIDKKKHKKYTGQSNEAILENLEYIADKVKNTDRKIWIRTPIIPNTTDTDENIRGITRFIIYKSDKWELCAFNNLCKDKYKRLYIEWDYQCTQLMSKERMTELVQVAKDEGYINVSYTGAMRLD